MSAVAFEPPDVRDVELEVIYADEQIMVVNKPSGLLSIPARDPTITDNVVARVRALRPESTGPLMVHRLDMDTSGLMVLGLESTAQKHLSAQFEERTVFKEYAALLDGRVEQGGGTIELAFRLDPDNRPHQVYDPQRGKLGITGWGLVGYEGTRSRVWMRPATGRTHQLRVHAAHSLGLGCPIAGDRLYGEPDSADRLCLHAEVLAFEHPRSGKRMTFSVGATF